MNKWFLSIVFSAIFATASACVSSAFEAKNYLTYRVADKSDWIWKTSPADRIKANCRAWQEATSKSIPWEDINEVVYKWSVEEISALRGKDFSSENSFAQWIVSYDRSIIDFLLLAKENERVRFQAIDPWYYPYPGDGICTKLDSIATIAKAGLETKWKDRYALQYVRALTTQNKNKEIIQFWNETNIKDSLMFTMTREYVAGAYYRTGDYDSALKMFAASGDASSIYDCLKMMGENVSLAEIIRQMAMNDNYDFVYTDLQNYVERLEKLTECVGDYSSDFRELADFSHEIFLSASKRHKLLWAYTESFAYWMLEDIDAADKALKAAEPFSTDDQIGKSAKVLRLLIDSRMRPLDKSYDEFLCNASSWLIAQAKADFAPWAKERSNEFVYTYNKEIGEWESHNSVGDYLYLEMNRYRNWNESWFYYTDMLRKMCVGYAQPRYLEKGDLIRALQLEDMSQFVLLPESAIKKAETHNNEVVNLAMKVSADKVVEFVERSVRPKDKYDRFFASHGSRCNTDFWNDLVGTILLREMRYAEAKTYLSKVKKEYFEHMSVFPYFDRNPFALEYISDEQCNDEDILIPRTWDYKLRFASKMAELERSWEKETEPNKKARMMLDYAIGIRNSIYPCWALTRYEWSSSYNGIVSHTDCVQNFLSDDSSYYDWGYEDDDYDYSTEYRAMRMKSFAIEQEAMRTFTDKELIARLEWTMGNYLTVAQHYADTKFAESRQGSCDRWVDYK